MTLSNEVAESIGGAVEHALGTNGPASLTLYRPGTTEPLAVVFVLPGRVGTLVDTFLTDLYALLGWRVDKDGPKEVH
jgi:hypothetical protein